MHYNYKHYQDDEAIHGVLASIIHEKKIITIIPTCMPPIDCWIRMHRSTGQDKYPFTINAILRMLIVEK
jgi:hypothetical protein